MSNSDLLVKKGKQFVNSRLAGKNGKPPRIRIRPVSNAGGAAIRDQLSAQLRKSRSNDIHYPDERDRNFRVETTTYRNILPPDDYQVFNKFVVKEDEDWLTASIVLRHLASKMSKKLSYTLGHIGYKHPNHIINTDFIKDLRFDGYDDGSKNEYKGEGTHYWFNMGLSLGESMVINPPFQFHANDDARTHVRYKKLGRLYAESIYTTMTVMSIMPGSVQYHTGLMKMVGLDGGMGHATATYIRTGGGGLKGIISGAFVAAGDALSVVAAIGSVIFGGGKVIEFKDRYPLYKHYVNGLLQSMAVNLGLLDTLGSYPSKHATLSLDHILPGISLRVVSGFKGWRANHILNFRIGNDIGVSESFSNSTTSNPLIEAMNSEGTEEEASRQTGDVSKMGATANGLMQILQGNAAQGIITLGKSWGTRIAGVGSQMMGIKSGAYKATFPELWESSSFSRSYSFNFTFHSPYGDVQSIFENCYIPVLMLLALALPRQIGGFTYIEPFTLRVVIPGLVNINFGIIESLSIERGEQNNDWTTRQIPKTFKVSLSIKDIDQIITMPLASKSLIKNMYPNLFSATGLSEYLVTMSGLSLAEQTDWREEMGRNLKRWTSAWRNALNRDSFEASITGIGFIRNLNQFLWGSIDVGEAAKRDDINMDKLNDQYIQDGRIFNMNPKDGRTMIGRWVAKVFSSSKSEKDVEVKYLKRNEFGTDYDNDDSM